VILEVASFKEEGLVRMILRKRKVENMLVMGVIEP
jgi:hypothetical protein